jgi:hypothetical protein
MLDLDRGAGPCLSGILLVPVLDLETASCMEVGLCTAMLTKFRLGTTKGGLDLADA